MLNSLQNQADRINDASFNFSCCNSNSFPFLSFQTKLDQLQVSEHKLNMLVVYMDIFPEALIAVWIKLNKNSDINTSEKFKFINMFNFSILQFLIFCVSVVFKI